MKNILKLTLLFLALTMAITGCTQKTEAPESSSANESVESVEDNKSPVLKKAPISSLPEDVIEITVSPYESDLMTFKYTDAEKINNVMDYLKGLRISTTDDDPSNYTGGINYKFVLKTSDGTVKNYYIDSDSFFIEEDKNGDWFKISEYQIGIGELLKANENNVQDKKPLFQETE